MPEDLIEDPPVTDEVAQLRRQIDQMRTVLTEFLAYCDCESATEVRQRARALLADRKQPG